MKETGTALAAIVCALAIVSGISCSKSEDPSATHPEETAVKEAQAPADAGKAPSAKVLVLIDDDWGANNNIRDGAPSIIESFVSYGWELTFASAAADPSPCPIAANHPRPDAMSSIVPIGEVGDVAAYDALVILPGRGHEATVADGRALELVAKAKEARLAIAAICRGARVLAAAKVIDGVTMTGHPDYRAEYEASGARFMEYRDMKGKSDAPPPVVDGLIVTALRANYYRGAICEAIRIAVGNSRRSRGLPSAAGSRDPVAFEAPPEVARASLAPKARTIAFAMMANPQEAKMASLCVASLRRFGGGLSAAPVAVFVPGGAKSLSAADANRLAAARCIILDFGLPDAMRLYDLCDKVAAAAAAETWALQAGVDALAWLDPDTVFLREPSELLLDRGFAVGGRPVHHLLIGMKQGSEPDLLWASLEALSGAADANLFTIKTTIDRDDAKLYINAGFIVVRPEAGILGRWKGLTERAIADGKVQAAIDTPTSRLFLHQAALACAIASSVPQGCFMEFSFAYNFPLHMASDCPATLKPGKLDDLYTARYDAWRAAPGKSPGKEAIVIPASMELWFSETIAQGK
jgi:hypothetical protein